MMMSLHSRSLLMQQAGALINLSFLPNFGLNYRFSQAKYDQKTQILPFSMQMQNDRAWDFQPKIFKKKISPKFFTQNSPKIFSNIIYITILF